MITKWLLVFSLFICTTSYAGNYVYEYDTNCSKGYQYYMSLHLLQGRQYIYKEFGINPYNLMATYISDYEDCLILLFNGNRIDYDQRISHFEERLAVLNKGDENSPWFRFCKAGLYMHWALVNFRFGENLKAATEFRRSYLLIKENERLYPAFENNKIFAGIGEVLTGTIPDNYKWIASILGLRGSVSKGAELLSGFINSHNQNDALQAEAIIYYTYMQFYFLSQKEQVWNYLSSKEFSTDGNLLNTFLKANIALNYRKADVAITTLSQPQNSKEYLNYPIFDFETGSALLYKLDTNCLYYLQRFLKNYKGTTFIKDTWQMMGLSYYMQDKMPQARYCKAYIKNHGTAQVDADKQAQRFSEKGHWPDKTLLEARLLIDGGYYWEALAKLKTIDQKSFSSAADMTEYLLRMGRVWEELKDDYKALQYYRSAINEGKNRPEYFAARAAVQMASVYERQGKKKEALATYEEALNMREHDFQSSIDQLAKAGINRLSGK